MKLALVAAAAMASAAVVTTAPAAATPMFPLAPPVCQKYKIPGFANLITGDKEVFTAWSPDGNGGKANYDGFGAQGAMGEIVGGMNGTRADFTIVWTKGPDAQNRHHFVGDVRDDLSLDGTWVRGSDGLSASWHLYGPVECVGPAAAANKSLGNATVVADTDIYDKPDGKGKKIGTLYVGAEHPLMEPCRDDWCRLGAIELGGFEGLPNGTAWAYSKGFLTFP